MENKTSVEKRRQPTRQKKQAKTPLQQFDVTRFFEENLFDIIELEENRSGVEEFLEAARD